MRACARTLRIFREGSRPRLGLATAALGPRSRADAQAPCARGRWLKAVDDQAAMAAIGVALGSWGERLGAALGLQIEVGGPGTTRHPGALLVTATWSLPGARTVVLGFDQECTFGLVSQLSFDPDAISDDDVSDDALDLLEIVFENTSEVLEQHPELAGIALEQIRRGSEPDASGGLWGSLAVTFASGHAGFAWFGTVDTRAPLTSEAVPDSEDEFAGFDRAPGPLELSAEELTAIRDLTREGGDAAPALIVVPGVRERDHWQRLMADTALEVVFASDLASLRRRLECDDFCAVVVDADACPGGGLGALALVRDACSRAPPMLVVASFPTRSHLLSCLAAGARDYLRKPVTAASLAESVIALQRFA